MVGGRDFDESDSSKSDSNKGESWYLQLNGWLWVYRRDTQG